MSDHDTDSHHMHTYDQAGEHAQCPIGGCFWNADETWSPALGRYV